MAFRRIASLKTLADFHEYQSSIDVDLPLDTSVETGGESPLGQASKVDDLVIGNRFSILPMEGWDGTVDGKPTDLTRRRWRNFGLSGAKLIWGGEAVAVRHDGRANPNQLMINDGNLAGLEELRSILLSAHEEAYGSTGDLLLGLQLTHSGRWAKPNEKTKAEPRPAHANVALDQRQKISTGDRVMSDDELRALIELFVKAAKSAASIGFQFVDVKHCHGYLGHELLSGVDREGDFGGSFENRTRFLREIVAGIRAEAPSLGIGVRISIFDFLPYRPSSTNIGEPDPDGIPRYAFGGDESGNGVELTEPHKLMDLFEELGIKLVCTTAGSPYYNPHIQRPAYFPPSDGYQPPEDPLVGVERQIKATAELKARHPNLFFVGSGYSYLQEWLPNVGQAVVRQGMADSIGLGRMVLSYPELPADVLAGNVMPRKKVCRTFSDCTTAPRNGIVSGCYPLDPFYKKMPERDQLKSLKQDMEIKG